MRDVRRLVERRDDARARAGVGGAALGAPQEGAPGVQQARRLDTLLGRAVHLAARVRGRELLVTGARAGGGPARAKRGGMPGGCAGGAAASMLPLPAYAARTLAALSTSSGPAMRRLARARTASVSWCGFTSCGGQEGGRGSQQPQLCTQTRVFLEGC